MNKKVGISSLVFSVRQLLTPVIIMLSFAFVITLIAPIFIENEYWDQRRIPEMAALIHFVVTAVGVMMSNFLCREKNIIAPLIAGSIWFVLMLCTGALLFDGAGKNTFLCLIACLVGTVGANLLQLRRTKRSSSSRKGRRHR